MGSKPAKMVQAVKRNYSPSQPALSTNTKVSELMLENGREWKLRLIEEICLEEDKVQIKAIQPCGIDCEDTYTWDYTRQGYYTVKSGYWVQMNIINAAYCQQEVNQPSLDELNQRVWKMDTSPKVQHFLWRCLS